MASTRIRSQQEFTDWLVDKPADWVNSIVTRSALRVLPLAFEAVHLDPIRTDPFLGQNLVIQAFRAIFSSWAACMYPTRGIDTAHSASTVIRAANAATQAASTASNVARAAWGAAATVAAEKNHDLIKSASRTVTAAHKAILSNVMQKSSVVTGAIASNSALDFAWGTISADCEWLEKRFEPLINQRLWLYDSWGDEKTYANQLQWTRAPLEAFDKLAGGTPWHLVAEWYRAIFPTSDTRPVSLFGEDATVVLATQPDNFWTVSMDRPPNTIMNGIAEIVARNVVERFFEWDFFLSHSKHDLPAAKRISDVLEQAGYTVFSQFNDMTAGKSFVREMNRGLDGMGRLIAVYSPNYFESGPCQAEWEAAYTLDPSGEAGKIVPFLVHPCDPTPLARRLIWTSLLGLDPAAEKEAILGAVAGTPSPRDRASQRAAVKRSISPDVTLDSSGSRLDVAPNAAIDDPFVDVGLLELPETLRSLIATALDALAGRNAPSGLAQALRAYASELDARGVNCMTGVLRGQMDFIEAEIDDPDASDWLTGAGLKKTLKNLRSGHGLLVAHFPLDQAKERLIRDIEVSESKLEASNAYADIELEIARGIEEAFEADLVTEQFRNVSASRQRVTRDILEVRTPMVPTSGGEEYIRRERDRALRVEDAKKRAVIQQAGFADKTLDVMTKVATLADSPATNRLLKALERLVVWFW